MARTVPRRQPLSDPISNLPPLARRRSWRPVLGAPIAVVVAARPGRWSEMARRCLEPEEDLQVVAESTDAERTITLVRTHRPVVVLLDREIPRRGALRVMPEFRRARRPPRVLAVARERDDGFAVEVIRGGGHGLMVEEALPAYLPKAVRRLAAGETWLTRAQEAQLLAALWHLTNGNRG